MNITKSSEGLKLDYMYYLKPKKNPSKYHTIIITQ